MSETVTAVQALKLLREGAAAIDVRSEGEFALGSIPGFTNGPILNNEHRHLVGIEYKSNGQDAAISLGHTLVDPKKNQLVERWAMDLGGNRNKLVTCWRGGLRSKTAAQWLKESGVQVSRVEGGYKAMRVLLLLELEKSWDLLVLSGLTGSGKTELLWQLADEFVLDLEELANHRGSAFGGFMTNSQPAQQTFENTMALKTFQKNGPFICESESRMIGQCVLPNNLKDRMQDSPRVILECHMMERVRRIHKEYVLDPLAADTSEYTWQRLYQSLNGSLARVQRKLGGLRYQGIQQQLQRPFLLRQKEINHHEEWIVSLLKEYYDPLYSHAASRAKGPVVFKGEWQECYEYFTSCIVGWRARAHSSS